MSNKAPLLPVWNDCSSKPCTAGPVKNICTNYYEMWVDIEEKSELEIIAASSINMPVEDFYNLINEAGYVWKNNIVVANGNTIH